jgi:5-formyltetrahydrofolate cyclo-ligase
LTGAPPRAPGLPLEGGHHGFIPSSQEDVLRARVKAELRKRMRGLRKALPASACAERSARIVERLGAVSPIAQARAVALFQPMEDRHEVDLRPLGSTLIERGVRVAYPAVDPETRAMAFRFTAGPDDLEPGAFGILEPKPHCPEALPGSLDAIVVPCLAADPRGQRIGYGAGFYDRALPRFAPPAAAIVVAFDFQLLAEIPETPLDFATGWVVTDARTLTAEVGGGTP